MPAAGHPTKLGPRTSVAGVGDALKVDPSASATSLDAVRMQVCDSVTAVQRSAASLDSALSPVSAAELAADLPPLKAALAASADDLAAYGASLRAVINGGEQAVRMRSVPHRPAGRWTRR